VKARRADVVITVETTRRNCPDAFLAVCFFHYIRSIRHDTASSRCISPASARCQRSAEAVSNRDVAGHEEEAVRLRSCSTWLKLLMVENRSGNLRERDPKS